MSIASFSAGNALIITSLLGLTACTQEPQQTWVTIADARVNTARLTDIGKTGDSVGDILTFDQPLLNADMKEIGTNSGTCIRTRVGHSFQCQWTLTVEHGSIQVAGRELDQGTSIISIVGGTGKYSGISGKMESTNNNDGTFTQLLRYRIR